MRIFIKTALPKLVPLWTQRVLFAGGILMLGYCGFVLLDTFIFQKRENDALARFVPAQPGVSNLTLPAIGPDGLIGRIEVERLGVSVVLLEGTSSKTLRRAVGHIAGTGLPGQPGNMGIAGHRDTFFRPLRNIQPDDIITLTTLRGAYRYRVVSAKVVSPDNVAVLDSDGDEILTLVTCYPFYFVGSAPGRFIVRAERVI
ncbi:MAG: class D sortase [Acidobacteriia bacterium]|nr:class D sortase [Terriglobia bacterium]